MSKVGLRLISCPFLPSVHHLRLSGLSRQFVKPSAGIRVRNVSRVLKELVILLAIFRVPVCHPVV